MSKIKVIHIVHDFLFGGIEAFLFYLTQAQILNDNLEVSILCCQEQEKVSNVRITNSGVKIYYVKVDPFDLHLSRYRELIKITNNYDVINLHIFKPLLAESLRWSKAKIVYTNHSAGVIGRSSSFINRLKYRLLVRFLNKLTHSISNNSFYTKQFWIDNGVTNPNNYVIYNGVLFTDKWDDDRAFNEFPVLKGKFIVGTTSRFIRWKRIEYLIEAFNKFQEDKDDVVLLLVGDGAMKNDLVTDVIAKNISKKVVFSGFKTSVIDFQVKMNICVFASNAEPFGLVAVECLHLGKPTIVFNDGGGITEIIEGIEKENIVDSIDHLVELLNKKYQEYRELSDDPFTLKRVEYSERFNAFEIEKEFYTMYNKVINS